MNPFQQINKPAFFREMESAKLIGGLYLDEQMSGLDFLLRSFAADPRFNNNPAAIPQAAYILATIAHECCVKRDNGKGDAVFIRTFQPVREMGGPAYFAKYDGRASLGNTQPGDGARFHGRGFVQNTGRRNAAQTGNRLAGQRITRAEVEALADEHLAKAFERLRDKTNPPASLDSITIAADTFTKEPELLLVPRVSYADMMSGFYSGRYTGKKITDYINAGKCDYVGARRCINGTDRASDIARMAEKIEGSFLKAMPQVGFDPAQCGEDKTVITPVVLYDPARSEVKPVLHVTPQTTSGICPPAPPAMQTETAAPTPINDGGFDIAGRHIPGAVVEQAKVIAPQARSWFGRAFGWIATGFTAFLALREHNPALFWAAVVLAAVLIAVGAYVTVQKWKINANPDLGNIK